MAIVRSFILSGSLALHHPHGPRANNLPGDADLVENFHRPGQVLGGG